MSGIILKTDFKLSIRKVLDFGHQSSQFSHEGGPSALMEGGNVKIETLTVPGGPQN
jgi:hypothetical protein